MINFNVFAGMTLAFEKRLQKKVEFFFKKYCNLFCKPIVKKEQ